MSNEASMNCPNPITSEGEIISVGFVVLIMIILVPYIEWGISKG
jgi:hypothetical protein